MNATRELAKRNVFKENMRDLLQRNGKKAFMEHQDVDDVLDYPPCESCGENCGGVNVCTGCQSAFYCSRECQVAAWKQGHKKECKHMEAESKATAEEVVNVMLDTSLSCDERIGNEILDRLSRTACYKAALACGLNTALQKLMKEEIKRLSTEDFLIIADDLSYVHQVQTRLFRGGRREGHGVKSCNAHRKWHDGIDAHRCKSYIMSSPDAFEDMFRASMESTTFFLHRDIVKVESHRVSAMMVTSEVTAAWILMFLNKKVSKAIILGESKISDKETVQRVKWMAKQFKRAFIKFWNAPEGIDMEGHIECNIRTLCAVIALRLKEYKVPVDFLKVLGLKGTNKLNYIHASLPVAENMIRKGKFLNEDEMAIVMKGGKIEY